jgi:LysM repeat protein
VRPGDSLSAIAVAHGTSVTMLASLNRLSPDAVLLVGSTLELPGPSLPLRNYRVRSGDTLTSIAGSCGCSVSELARVNRMSLRQTLLSGSILRIPIHAKSGTTYTVRPGDSLSSIALHYRVSLGALADMNHIALSDVLPIGRSLRLPANTVTDALGTFTRSTVRGSIVFWANHYNVDAHLATALAWMESGFNNDLVSTAGAVGVMQITPATWDYVEQVLLLGRRVPHDANGNVRIGVAYLHHLLHLYGGNERQALAAYYQGARALQEAGFLPGTAQYVDDILALKQRL